MKKNLLFVILFCFLITLGLMPTLFAERLIITLDNGADAILYLPETFQTNKRYPIIMALHGKEDAPDSTFNAWKTVADTFDMILICPRGSNFEEGYQREPTDDRKICVQWLQYLDKRYLVDLSRSYLVGFSRGGNYAIEIAAHYPHKFRTVVSIFGFYNQSLTPLFSQQAQTRAYKHSAFYFITSKGDASEASVQEAHQLFKRIGIKSHVRFYTNLFHAYPTDLVDEMARIIIWSKQR